MARKGYRTRTGKGVVCFNLCGIIGTLPAQRNPDKPVNNRLAPTGNHGPGQKGNTWNGLYSIRRYGKRS
jgi:hypothetical protein